MGEILGKFLCDFWVFLLYNFENIVLLATRIDASEISRSLSIQSVNVGGSCYKLVNVHLTNQQIGIGSKYMLEKIVLFATILSISFLVVFDTLLK